MGRLIDADATLDYIKANFQIRPEFIIEHAPTVEAIPKDQYEARIKADLLAMLEELKDKILHGHTFDTGAPIEFQHGIDYARRQDLEIIRQKINALKDNSHE